MTHDYAIAGVGTVIATTIAILFAVADQLQSPAPLWMPLFNTSVGLACLAWFMFRNENKLEELAKTNRQVANAIDRSTQAQMVTMLALKTLDKNPLQELAEKIRNAAHDAEHENTDS